MATLATIKPNWILAVGALLFFRVLSVLSVVAVEDEFHQYDGDTSPLSDDVSAPAATVGYVPNRRIRTPSPLGFNRTFGSYMVLQQSPAKAAVFGAVGAVSGSELPEVSVTVLGDRLSEAFKAEVTVGASGEFLWKALLRAFPGNSTANYSISASCTGGCEIPGKVNTAVLTDVVFGDVYYCSGQSNMWLPLTYTFEHNRSMAQALAGEVGNIRGMFGDSQAGVFQPWATAQQAAQSGALTKFSAACYYFAEHLTQLLGGHTKAPVFGLISTAVGGSVIEEWTLNTTTKTCREVAPIRTTEWQTLFDQRVRPYLNVTVKGFLWYQGENNCHGTMGNSFDGTGYGCQLPAMVRLWRSEWSRVPGTTDPLAPFGVMTLAAGGSEGGADMGGMRWSQTANYGVLPNPAMPATFLAQAFDIGDPWPSKACYSRGCCVAAPDPFKCATCKTYCDILHATNYYMGPIHPRIKQPLGARAAIAAFNTILSYGGKGPYTGPTISGCGVQLGGKTLLVEYDHNLLRGEAVSLHNHVMSGFRILTNASLWCEHPATTPSASGSADCLDNLTIALRMQHNRQVSRAFEQRPPINTSSQGLSSMDIDWPASEMSAGYSNPYESSSAWMAVDASVVPGSKNLIALDLAPLKGAAPYAIRYAWQDTEGFSLCCFTGNSTYDSLIGIQYECPPGSCPVFGAISDLPGNPFQARVIDGKCKCMAPQVCDSDVPVRLEADKQRRRTGGNVEII